MPDATPEIVLAYAHTDEQALLAKVRYNRLIDVFLGVTAYSLQSHLRTTVKDIGQIEIDEIYVAIDATGRQFVLPVQAKGGKDQLSAVQSEQDMAFCRAKYPSLICRAVSAQFMEDDLIAMFEVTLDDDVVKVVVEKHYRLSRSFGYYGARSQTVRRFRWLTPPASCHRYGSRSASSIIDWQTDLVGILKKLE